VNIQDVLEKILERKRTQWTQKREKFRQEIIDEKERIRLEEIRLKEEEERRIKEEEERKAREAAEGEGGEGDEEAKEEPPKEEEKPKEDEKAEDEGEGKEEEPPEPEPPKKDNIDDDFSPVLMNIWDNIENTYITKMRDSFDLYRNQRDRIITGLSKTQKYFVQFLNRTDDKQALLKAF
jgi:hypothetical protein